MKEKIKNKIISYYSDLNIYEKINFSDKILLFSESSNNNAVDIYVQIKFEENEFKVLTFLNNNLIKEINFYSIDNFYFYFLKNISEDYFLRNISFYSNEQLKLEAIVRNNANEKFKKNEAYLGL